MTDPNPPRQRDEQQEEKWYEKTPYQILLFVVGIAFFGLVLGLILDWYIGPKNSTQKKDLVQALGLITAGVAGAVGIYFTWRSQRLTRQAQEENQRNTLAQLKNAEKQLRLSQQSQEDNQRNTQEQLEQARNELDITRQGQITERFTRAIDQLGETDDNGEPKLELRLGGIYALERIAKDSPEKDYSTVMEVLTAYARQNSSTPSKGTNETTDHKEPRKELRADIKAVLDVVGRRQEDRVPEEHRVPPDFRAINLSNTILSSVNLRGANLSEANLRVAALSGANLSEANLFGANLTDANLYEADLRGSVLVTADLSGAYPIWVLATAFAAYGNVREYRSRV